jgi:uncharacterized protein (TIGR04168 family)
VKLAVIGDIHTAYAHAADGPALSRGLYDAVLVVGDLAGLRFGPCLQVASELAALAIDQTVLVQPGNHDTASPVQLLAEVIGTPWLSVPSTRAQLRRFDAYLSALGAAECMAYRARVLDGLTVIGGRPFSMGGPRLAFRGILARRFGVRSLDDSTDRMCALVDDSSGPILFLAHNGPTGLGGTRRDIWGRDFHPAEGDWGDADLRRAITYAQQSGRTVLAVVAGHMHHYIRGGRRTWHVKRDGVHYVNAAAVPRVTREGRHHVAMTIAGSSVEVEARWVR